MSYVTASSFTKKALALSITLESGTFPGGKNTMTLAGLRMEAEIEKSGHPSKNHARIKVFGMAESDMNMLTTLPGKSEKPLAVHKNLVRLQAGDANGMAVAFQGEITGAWAVYRQPPDLYFHLEAMEGFYPAIASASPTSVRGGASVRQLMLGFAKQMGYAFEDNGVTAQLANPYFHGTALQQASAVAAAADIEFGIDNGTLFICPRGGARKGKAPLISAETGLKEYPVFNKKGIKLETLYNPAVSLGGLIVVKSAVQVANGTWRVNGLRHHLECENPSGPWITRVSASWVGN